MAYKIKSIGSRGNILCQLDRIDKGFKSLGNELVNDGECDFIYVNDHNYHSEGIEYKKQFPKSKLILNTLDLPIHCREYKDICDQLSLNFYFADSVTTISDTVREQMLSVFPHTQRNGIDVIYQPIKPIKPLKLERNGCISVFGRQRDPNKNFGLVLSTIGMIQMDVNIIGPEDPTGCLTKSWKDRCHYKGLVSDKQLNIEYNSASVVLICSAIEGLCLPLIETLVAKTPVVCVSTMQTAKEFCPKEFICNNNPYDISEKIQYVTSGDSNVTKILNEFSEKYSITFSPESVANNIIKSYEKTK